MTAEFWDREKDFWKQGPAEAARRLDVSCLFVHAAWGILNRDRLLTAMQEVPRWKEVALSDQKATLADEVVALAYRVLASRPGQPEYRALCSTTWVNRSGEWRILLHQQTAI
ncbi:DUF4440 domain-containing protein [Paracoccus sulfuroxidans]|uniref:Uncharacterized protein DUF4440 n=1 Tax=Paracoccus sulfuroxidans TaxID=384678 RepID=A0A562P1R0_9RHOB|nr:DUF4440 domain-containing protein [Paracoccus sulfuroxidans]TWI37926.1 uncharacterized protein DUF4440 [Paracoccus sulfuroxidans]